MSNYINCRKCGREVSEKSIQDGSHECDPNALLERIEDVESRAESLSRMQAGTLAIFYATAATAVAGQAGPAETVNALMVKCLDASPASHVWIPVQPWGKIDEAVRNIVSIVEQIVEETP